MTITIILKNGKELTSEEFQKDKVTEFTKFFSNDSVEFITFTNTDNGSILIVRKEDISAVLYGIS